MKLLVKDVRVVGLEQEPVMLMTSAPGMVQGKTLLGLDG